MGRRLLSLLMLFCLLGCCYSRNLDRTVVRGERKDLIIVLLTIVMTVPYRLAVYDEYSVRSMRRSYSSLCKSAWDEFEIFCGVWLSNH